MIGWLVLYAGLTLGCCVTVFEAYRRDPMALTDLRTAALILLATFVISNLSTVFLSRHAAFYPLTDMLCGAAFLLQWRSNLKWWSLALFFTSLIESAEHLSYAQQGDHSFAARYAYDFYLNVCYVVQLCIVTAPAFVAIIERRKGRVAP